MADPSDIPTGTYTLTLGKTFESPVKSRKSGRGDQNLHTLRYDFKPSSVSQGADTYIAFGQNGDVHVSVPSEGDTMTVFKGSKKEAKPKECLLFFDRNTNTVRLEKITSNINVKATRDMDAATEQALKKGIERLRTTSGHLRSPSLSPERKSPVKAPQPPPPIQTTHSKARDSSDSSSDSDNSSDSDKSNADSSDDEDESALLEQMNQNPAPPTAATNLSTSNNFAPQETYHMPSSYATSSSSRDKRNSEKYGLALSESSDED